MVEDAPDDKGLINQAPADNDILFEPAIPPPTAFPCMRLFRNTADNSDLQAEFDAEHTEKRRILSLSI